MKVFDKNIKTQHHILHLSFHCCYMHHAVITNMPILEGSLRCALFTISLTKIRFHPIRSRWESAEVFMAVYVSRMEACYTLPCSFFSTQRNFLWILQQIKPYFDVSLRFTKQWNLLPYRWSICHIQYIITTNYKSSPCNQRTHWWREWRTVLGRRCCRVWIPLVPWLRRFCHYRTWTHPGHPPSQSPAPTRECGPPASFLNIF